MRAAREKTRYEGVMTRQLENKRTKEGKPDICFDIVYYINGKKKFEALGYKSDGWNAKKASEIRTERLKSIRIGKPLPVDNYNKQSLSVGDAWACYERLCFPNYKSDHQRRTERGRYINHIDPHFGEYPLAKVTVIELEDFKQKLSGKLAPKTVCHVLSLFQCLYNKMINFEKYDGPNPLSKISFPKVDNARDRFLSKEEAQSLMTELQKRSYLDWQISAFSLMAGLRLGEIIKLTWNDIDFQNKIIHVRSGKTGSRNAFLNNSLKKVIDTIEKKGTLIFPGPDGNVRQSGNCVPTFERVVKLLKLNEGITDRRNKVVFHSLRHTYASWLAIEGVSLYKIGKLLGHSSLEMTKRYAHLCPNNLRETANLVEDGIIF